MVAFSAGVLERKWYKKIQTKKGVLLKMESYLNWYSSYYVCGPFSCFGSLTSSGMGRYGKGLYLLSGVTIESLN